MAYGTSSERVSGTEEIHGLQFWHPVDSGAGHRPGCVHHSPSAVSGQFDGDSPELASALTGD